MTDTTETQIPTNDYVNKMDEVLMSFFDMVERTVTESTAMVLNGSTTYLTEEQREPLIKFRELYLDHSKIREYSESVNEDVDQIIAGLQKKIESGDFLDFEDENAEKRMSLAGLQKELEVIARLDIRIQEILHPLVMELQCEDILSQLISHLVFAFKLLAKKIKSEPLDLNAKWDNSEMLTKIEEQLTMFEERKIFQRCFFDREISEDDEQDERVTFF